MDFDIFGNKLLIELVTVGTYPSDLEERGDKVGPDGPDRGGGSPPSSERSS